MRSHYNLNIFKFSASGQNCTHPAFWPAARVRRTSVFTAGENLGAGAALPTPSIEIPKGGDRLRRSEPKTKGHPFGCPFVLSSHYNLDISNFQSAFCILPNGPSGPRRFCGVRAFCQRQNLGAGRIHFARAI